MITNKPTVKQLLARQAWTQIALAAALVLLACIEIFDFVSKAITVRISVASGVDEVQPPAEVHVDGRRGSAWVNGKKVW